MKLTIEYTIPEDKLTAFMGIMQEVSESSSIQKIEFQQHTDFLIYKTWCEANFLTAGKVESLHQFVINNTEPMFIEKVKAFRKYLVNYATTLKERSHYEEGTVIQAIIEHLDGLVGGYIK